MARGWTILLTALLLGAAAADTPDETAIDRLRAGDELARNGRVAEAWQAWQYAYQIANRKYLALEATARMAALTQPGNRDHAAAVGLTMALFNAVPPRWLTDAGRNLLAETIKERAASGAYPNQRPDPGIRQLSFGGVPTAYSFRGSRYFWMAHVADIPPPVDQYRIEGEPVQTDDDHLPVGRLPVGDGWAVVEPQHADAKLPEETRDRWRFDRCLVGYTYQPFVDYTNLKGESLTAPTPRWYEGQKAIWQLRFRLFYPSTPLAGADLAPLAENLMDALLRASWLGAESLGRTVKSADWDDQVVDVWLTPNAADAALEAGGERWQNNLYFYQANTPRQAAEWVREALHEYGHAMMPRIGRYTGAQQYETWLDGPLGERLLLRLLEPSVRSTPDAALSPWMRELRQNGYFASYRREQWDPPFTTFIEAGPLSGADQATDDRGAAWLIGFAEWLFEAHEPRFVADFWSPLSPTSQYTATALVANYMAAIKDQKTFTLNALRPVRKLTDAAPAANGEGLELGEAQGVEYLVWLPRDQWHVRLLSVAPGAVTFRLGRETERVVETGTSAQTAPALTYTTETGWYRLSVTGFGPRPTILTRLQFNRLAPG